ncbi:potassium/proton antiporter [Alkalilimnicola ehrlichii MLHE-1]|uniref:Potassium/proton antiporter, CPA1 family n=1 Tax=Alkalilimnicola ehrlichii (strain ATCC BAA-1101 / DSM 17681 / MLHE-1) TaxID=187272 RepID=Q0AAX6_ALKEH|nr:potassium/proton antiporter [Alkalilimnicola ehrlichii]ABI56011.1 potassium/proton antiporter, CPA1 family [Alkalilimnicola ehrlichii MLHE-1]
MDWIYPLILIGAGLIALSVFTSVIAFRFGAPLLLVFLCIGLIAGEDGLGFVFNDADLAYLVGSLALAVILFDSGFGTPVQTLRRAAGPAIILATVGVLLTTLLVGVAAHFLFDLPWPYAFLMGAIVSSTDAAAVFFLLRAGGVKIYKRVRSVLEVESGSNDPMAIFLTLFFIELILAGGTEMPWGLQFLLGFGQQMGLGLVMGLVAGFLIVELVNRIQLEEALYPIAVMAMALCLFAATGYLGGSGFLAVYVAGIVAGNRAIRGAAKLRQYQAGMTWLAQIIMFLVLGLIATPSEFIPVAMPAIALGLFLMLIARPLAVWLCVLPFRLEREATTFLSWVGLRGAVSILLGILPIVAGVENGQLFLNVAFIMVLTSLLIQGWTIRPAARRLNLIVPEQLGPVERVELALPGAPRHELAVYRVTEDSPVGKGEPLPRWARPSLVVRNEQTIRYQDASHLQPGDYVYIFIPPDYLGLLDRVFARPVPPSKDDQAFFGELRINPDQPLSALQAAYGVDLGDLPPDESIAEHMRRALQGRPVVGDRVPLGPVELIVRAVRDKREVTDVGLALGHQADPEQPGHNLPRLLLDLLRPGRRSSRP